MSTPQAQSKREMPIAEVAHLIDLVSYQEGAVVSRTLISRPTGTVTLFAFDDGQGLSEHTAPFDALAHVLEGEAEIVVSGKPLPTKCLSYIILSPLNGNVKMSPHETGDIHVESEGAATSGCNLSLCEGGTGVCQSRRTA